MMMMTRRISILVALLASFLALDASTAYASLSDEVNAGKTVFTRVDAGTATCKNLSDTDFEHLGEYVMERMVRSRSAHEAMNSRMDAMMGSENADRMHQALGRRYAGCATTGTSSGYGMMGGSGMMGGGTGGWGAMMGSDLSWLRNRAWQHMSRADWQRAGGQIMGSEGMMSTDRTGLSTAAVIAVVVGALLLGGLAVYVVLRRPWRHGPSHPTAT